MFRFVAFLPYDLARFFFMDKPLRDRADALLATAAASSFASSKPADAELRLRAERAEQQVADLKAALENIKKRERPVADNGRAQVSARPTG